MAKRKIDIKRPSLLTKLYDLYKIIESKNFPTNEELQRKLEVSEKTIDRYISIFRDNFGAPIKYDRYKKGYCFTEKWEFPFPKLTEGEIFSLLISINLIEEFKNTPLEDTFKSLSQKLELLLPEEISIKSKEIEMILSVSLSPIKMKVNIKEIFEKIFSAIRNKKRILANYYSIERDEITQRKIDPYHIYNYEGVWYFFGYCHLRKEIRDFALDRIQKIRILSEKFEFPKDFDAKEYLSKAFRMYKGNIQRVKILFDSYQARWIKERIWHENQKIIELDNGEIIFEIEGHPEELKRFILSYGKHAKVLEPESFKEIIERELKDSLKNYE
ncbi:MAG: WYL domain-containing protein [Dictyoglomaceae bacterium]|nr:WYL domain-containing protein [Dictyoglomaceae bacterium]